MWYRRYTGVRTNILKYGPNPAELCLMTFKPIWLIRGPKGGPTQTDLASLTVKGRNINNDVIVGYDVIVVIMALHCS